MRGSGAVVGAAAVLGRTPSELRRRHEHGPIGCARGLETGEEGVDAGVELLHQQLVTLRLGLVGVEVPEGGDVHDPRRVVRRDQLGRERQVGDDGRVAGVGGLVRRA